MSVRFYHQAGRLFRRVLDMHASGKALRLLLLLLLWYVTPAASAQDREQLASTTPSPVVTENTLTRLSVLERHMGRLNELVSLRSESISLEDALVRIARQSGMRLTYGSHKQVLGKHIRLDLQDVSFLEALYTVLDGTGLKPMLSPLGHIVLVAFTPLPPAPVVVEAAPIVQTGSVTGRITDEDSGEPLPGATVVIDGTTMGASADLEGQYTIAGLKPGTYNLRASFVGYQSQLVEGVVVAEDQTATVDFTLATDLVGLDEVVVVGYGERSRRQITSAISTIGGEELENVPAASLDNMMQGKVAGVQVTQSSGAPGGAISVRIRGQTSIGGGNDPLYVVDGVPVKSGNYSGIGDETAGMNALADINPDDIQSIQILKDAAATSIYGARAANGVVLITTKRGQANRPVVNVSFYTGLQDVTRRLSQLNSQQMREYSNDAYRGAGLDLYNVVTDSLNPRFNYDTFWQDYLFQTAPMTNTDVSVSGGAQNIKYYLSGSFFDQDGVVKNSQFQRYTLRANVDYNFSERFLVGNSISYSNTETNRISEGGSDARGVFWRTLSRLPMHAAYDDQGKIIPNQPIANLLNSDQGASTNRILGNLFAEYQITSKLKFRSSLALDLLDLNEDRFYSSLIYTYGDYRRSASARSYQDLGWVNENYLSYNGVFNNRHSVNAVLGFSQQKNESETFFGMTNKAPTDLIPTLNAGAQKSDLWTFKTSHGLLSYFGRLNYDYLERYLFSTTARIDGSSRFGAGNRYGFFPSMSVGWRVSEEAFLRPVTWINDFKLRGSVGLTGNQSIPDFIAQGLYATGSDYMGLGGIAPAGDGLPNKDLSWESALQYDLGFDLTILRSRLSLVADYYRKTTSDLLFNVSLPSTSGFSSVLTNMGSIRNEGVEFELTTRNLTGSFGWTTSFNIGFNRNEVLELPEGESVLGGYYGATGILMEGEPIGTFFGYKKLGVFTDDAANTTGLRFGGPNGTVYKGGDTIYQDTNGDGWISAEDRVIIGNANPDFMGGLTNSFTYKNLELSVFVNFSYGNDVYNLMKWYRDSHNLGTGAGPSTEQLRRWRNPGDVTDIPRALRDDRLLNNRSESSHWVEDGSYLRLKNVTLAYNIPSRYLRWANLNRVRIYGMGQNLFTSTKYSGYDPEAVRASGSGGSSRFLYGIDNGIYPIGRTFTFGLNVGF